MECEAGHRLVLAKGTCPIRVYLLPRYPKRKELFVCCFKLMGVLLACMPVHQMCVLCSQRLEESTRSPETGVIDI